jgi:hypothetical protein
LISIDIRPAGGGPGTTRLAMDLRRAGADAHKTIDATTSWLEAEAAQAPPRRKPGRPKGTTRAAMEARRLEAEAEANPKPPSAKRRGGYRPGAGRKRKIIAAETPVQLAARHAGELLTMGNRHKRELTRLRARTKADGAATD